MRHPELTTKNENVVFYVTVEILYKKRGQVHRMY